jgi:CRP/FNR family transcriptional regulator
VNSHSLDAWEQLQPLKESRRYPAGTSPFEFGKSVDGIYLIESGQVRLSVPSRAKRAALFEVVGPGCVLALSEAMTGGPHKLTAEALVDCQISFVERSRFLVYLKDHPEFCMHIVRQLSEDLHGLYYRYRASTERGAKSGRKVFPPHVN